MDPAEIARQLRRHAPDTSATARARRAAAVAVVLHRGEVLFIRRAERRGDPWSGQVAFPGGVRTADDPDLAATARREAAEEVGILLPAPVGRLDDVRGRIGGVAVAPFVFTVPDRPPLRLAAREVAAATWIPLEVLADPASATRYHHRGLGPFPALRCGDFTIWGLTYRIVIRLLEVLGVAGR